MPMWFKNEERHESSGVMLKTFNRLKQNAAVNPKLLRLAPEEIAGLQRVLLDMLKDFDLICKQNDLQYILTGGSALGAERNGGFIEWDDDIDVLMPREDYEKLAQCVHDQAAEKYWVQSLYTSDVYDLNFMKFRKNGTRYVELFEPEPEKAGICIDVYPLDVAPSWKISSIIYGIINEALFFAASCVRMYCKRERLLEYISDHEIRRSIEFKACIGKLLFDRCRPRKWYFLCERWAKKVVDAQPEYMAVSSGRGHYFGERYKREKLFPAIERTFEGIGVCMAKDNDYLLSVLYGPKYILPPKESEREVHSVIELRLYGK